MGKYVYLSGPIDNVSDLGQGWRSKFISLAVHYHLNFDIYNPVSDLSYVRNNHKKLLNFKKHNQIAEAQEIAKNIRRKDLRELNKSDIVVLKVDPTIHMCGSYFEACIADVKGVRLFVIFEHDMELFPNWLLSYVDQKDIFGTVSECARCLQHIFDKTQKKVDTNNEMDDSKIGQVE